MSSSGIVKDPVTGFIYNTDHAAYEKYKLQRKAVIEKINNTNRIEKLEKDVSEIKQLLLEIKNGMT
jgi:hypothetical protein